MKNSKKIMSAILTALMVQSILTTGFAVTTSAYETPVNESTAQTQVQESKDGVYGDFEYSVSDGKVTITKYTGSDTEVVIPSEIEGLPVTGIGERCFAEHSGLMSVEIPDSVTDIGTEAFSYCINLENVTIPNSVTHIGVSAFAGCQSIERITVPNSVTYIDSSSFAGCSRLTNITIPNSVTIIGTYAFYECSSLASIKIPNSVSRLFPYVFYGCRNLKSIVLPNNLTSIHNDVFFDCDSLTDVYYTGSEEEWQSIAISTKDNDCLLNQATIHYNSVEQTEFEYTVANNEIIITKYTGTDTEVDIPSEIDGLPVTAIGDNAFQYCMNLTSVTIPDSVVSIGNYAFHVSGLTSVTIPENVTSIGEEAFGECFSLTSINVDSNNTEYSSVNGVLFNKNQTTIICYPVGKTERSYTIPDGVTSIGNFTFICCNTLTNVIIPESVIDIGMCAFYNCNNLADVYYTGSEVQWQNIIVNSTGNQWLTRATIHYNYKNIVDDFEYSVLDGEVTITRYNGNDTEVIIPSEIDGLPVTSIGFATFCNCIGLTGVTIPDTVTSIGSAAFQYCYDLKNITIPAFVTEINFSTFWDCTSLTDIAVSSDNIQYSSVDGILMDKNQTEIICYPAGKTDTSYTIPDTVINIGSTAFKECGYLTSVTIPESVQNINPGAFWNCRGLKNVVIPDGVTVIFSSTFIGCRNLASIVIPASVTKIMNGAFTFCYTLTDVYYMDSEKEWQEIIIQNSNECLTNAIIHYNCPNVVLDKEELTLEAGQMYTLTATANPPTETTFTWKSNNTSVATVNGSGRVVARGEGTAIITVISSDGKRAYCTVTVSPKKEIVLDKTELNLSVKEQYTLNPSMSPEDTTVTYTFKSNNTAVATVNKAGRIVARGEGTATITIIGSNGLKAYCTVNVTPQKVLVLDKTELNLSVKEQYTLTPSVIPEDTEVTYTFKSDNTAVATVNKAGRIVARGTGTAKITVKFSNGLTAVCNITVE